MSRVAERYVIAIPILMFLEFLLMIVALSVLFVFVGEAFNRLNNTGSGNILNAIGIAAAFYFIYGYFIFRLLTLTLALVVPIRRTLTVALAGGFGFAIYSALLMRPIFSGQDAWIWLVWLLVIAFDFALPFMLPKKIFE